MILALERAPVMLTAIIISITTNHYCWCYYHYFYYGSLGNSKAGKMEVYELSDKESQITIIKMLNKLRKMIHEQNKNFKKEI